MDNHTRKLLNLTDKSIIFEKDWLTEATIRGRRSNIIRGRLTSPDRICPSCHQNTCVKNGTYTTKTQLPEFNRVTTYLELKRERYLCKKCHTTFSADTTLVDDYCHISKTLKYQIALDLKEDRSRKEIARFHHVSDNTVQRVLYDFTNHCLTNFQHLPKVLCVDEFKSTKSCQSGMSFICADAESKKIIDILPDRRLFSLIKYFLKYSRKERLKVKFLVMDMNANYGGLLKTVFPHAEIVTDRFHIIQHINRSFNQLRIKEMNQLKRYDSEEAKQYRRIKKYWKLFLKDSSQLSATTYSNYPLFNKSMTQVGVIEELLSYNSTIKIAYDYIQELKYAYETKDSDLFLELTHSISNELPKEFKAKFKTFQIFRQGVTNALNYSYSNGFLEGINNRIKAIKRTAYGYRNFLTFKRRIFLIQGQSFQFN